MLAKNAWFGLAIAIDVFHLAFSVLVLAGGLLWLPWQLYLIACGATVVAQVPYRACPLTVWATRLTEKGGRRRTYEASLTYLFFKRYGRQASPRILVTIVFVGVAFKILMEGWW